MARALLIIPLLLAGALARLAADAPRVLPSDTLPRDRRLEPPKDLNGYFPFKVPATRQEWEARAHELRRRVLVATGLWPKPPATPLNAAIYGRSERDGFTVEKVHFESYPGHHVTGLLFRPETTSGRRPGVLCPHGHGGRLQDHGDNIRRLIVEGQERFEGSGRFPKLARCAQLARMGCVVFIYDMLGYADSVQISYELAHRYARTRPGFDTPESWGFYSTQAELRLQSIFGVQTYNSIRALDFLASLPDVDPARLGVTGGSGGGTQTIILGAIDPRPVVAFPQGMVSTSMQGGCTCENCCLLRIDSGNVELAALFAPKPLGMTAADDWTRDMMTKGYPELQALYSLYGARERVFCKAYLHFPHNYNYVTRALMYSWFNRHLALGLAEPIVEGDFRPLAPEERTVWDEDHPRPSGGDEYERHLTRQIAETAESQLAGLRPRDAASFARYREVVGGALEAIVGRHLPAAGAVSRQRIGVTERSTHREVRDLLRFDERGEELPVVSLHPRQWNGHVVVWLDGAGKAGLFQEDGSPRPEIATLLAGGMVVVGVDLFLQGEFLASGTPVEEAPVVGNPREFAGYTFCYNDTVFVRRVHDVLTVVAFVRDDGRARHLHLAGVRGAGPVVALASALLEKKVDRCLVDTGGFRFVDLRSYRDLRFLPGAVKYGDLPGMLSLSAPRELAVVGEGDDLPEIVRMAYRAAGTADGVRSIPGNVDQALQLGARWLLRGGES